MPGEHSGDPYGYKLPGNQAPKPKPKPRQDAVGGGKDATRLTSPSKKKSSSSSSKGGGSSKKSSSYSGGGGGGGSSYSDIGGAGSSSSGTISSLAAPAAPDLNSFLSGDDTYQSQQAALAKALADYKTQMGTSQTNYNTNYASGLRNLGIQEQRSDTDQADDYAGRGMLISGLYGKARGDMDSDYNRQEGGMADQRSQYLGGLANDLSNFQNDQGLQLQKAKQDAIDRRAAQYGL